MRYLFPTGKGYQRKWLGQDVLPGVVIAAVSIPISMGYAQIAGLPAVYGLYGSLLPVILFALLSTSPQFIFGVDAAPAAMIGGVLGGMGIAMGSAEAERVVPVLTFYVGMWLLLFALLIIRGYWLALNARDRFGSLVIVGITTLFAFQVFANVAVVTNLFPVTGISLPFFSYGGSALIIQLAEMGLILSISRQNPAS